VVRWGGGLRADGSPPCAPRGTRHDPAEAQPPRVRQRDPPIHHLAQQPRLRRTATPHPRPGRSLLAAL